MIKNSKIQLFLRNILLDGLEKDYPDIPVLFENTISKNKKDTYIVEQLIPTSEYTMNERVESGNGIYKITIFGNKGSGLKFNDIIDTVCGYFVKGEYIVDDESNIKVFIKDSSINVTLFDMSSDKIQKSLSVDYVKYRSY